MKKSREEILSLNPIFTRFIIDMQLAQQPDLYVEGDCVLLNDDKKETVLTKEQAENLNKEIIQEFKQGCDADLFEYKSPLEWISRSLLISSKETVSEYLNDIYLLLEAIRKEIDADYLMILGCFNIPWLYQDNDYLPVKEALKYLKLQIDDTFGGGFLLNKNELRQFIPHLFWLIRCNASLPEFYISYPNSNTIISICRYGVLHFEFFDKKEKNKILNLSSLMKFKEVTTCYDPIDFDEFEGRKLKISS